MQKLSTSLEDDLKIVRKGGQKKSFFRRVFCCFSASSSRGRSQSNKTPLSVNGSATSKNETTNFSNIGKPNESHAPSFPNVSTTTKTTNNSNSNNNNNNSNSNIHIASYSKGCTFSSSDNHTDQRPVQTTNNANTQVKSNNYAPYSSDVGQPYIPDKYLLPPIQPRDSGKKCLIIDLDETLVHSSFKPTVNNADFIVPVEIDGITHEVYVLKRPHVDEFLKRMGELFECVLFTASLSKYADPVSDLLDKWSVFRSRLFREACVYFHGNYVKDLSRLGRDLNKTIILDNSPASYIFHPQNAVSCISWFDDIHDTELLDLIPYFERLASCDSVYSILRPIGMNHDANVHQHNQYHQQPQQHQGGGYGHNMYIQSVNTYNNEASPIASVTPSNNQQVPSSQSIIYQADQKIAHINTHPSGTNTNSDSNNNTLVSNDDTSKPNNFNYMMSENKMLMSIDLMMATKEQQLQKKSSYHTPPGK